MSLMFAVVLGIIGLAALFVAPWIGAAVLAAAVLGGLIGVLWLGANAGELAERDEPETPHMRGPTT